MATISQIDELKRQLRREVSLFCRHNDRRWKRAIAATVDEMRDNHWPAVFFGGTLRSLLLSRLTRNTLGRPRDIDIVVRGPRLAELEGHFNQYISRKTRFGGLQLERIGWHFDVWPLEETFAFKEQGLSEPEFDDLPRSTFFNLEAIAMDVWSRPGKPRRVYSADDQFFRGVIDKTIEVNREENPFPGLCVVRAISLVGSLQWKVGPRLLRYIARVGAEMTDDDFIDIQRRHYGSVQWAAGLFVQVIAYARRLADRSSLEPVELPLPKQLTFWPELDVHWPRIHFSVATGKVPRSSRHPVVDRIGVQRDWWF